MLEFAHIQDLKDLLNVLWFVKSREHYLKFLHLFCYQQI